jgi:hypothetical protein
MLAVSWDTIRLFLHILAAMKPRIQCGRIQLVVATVS